jgi:hypothetical protein
MLRRYNVCVCVCRCLSSGGGPQGLGEQMPYNDCIVLVELVHLIPAVVWASNYQSN